VVNKIPPLTCPKCKGTSCSIAKSGHSIHCDDCRERFDAKSGVSYKTGINHLQATPTLKDKFPTL
jgi:hypothetical protein